MANNRLFLVHVPSGESFYLGKRMAGEWYDSPIEGLNEWFQSLGYDEDVDNLRLGMEDVKYAPEGTLSMHPTGKIDEKHGQKK